jgi:hypothetical protein
VSGPVPNAALEGGGPRADVAFLFAGREYYAYNWSLARPDPGYPRRLSSWELPGRFAGGIDDAVDGRGPSTGKAFFFRGAEYVEFDWSTETAGASPEPLSDWSLPAPFSGGIDAALNGSGEYAGKLYLFRGGEYVRYDWATGLVESHSAITAWGLPGAFNTGVTAALDGGSAVDGKAYLFRREQYVRYDWVAERVDPGYPRPVDDWELAHSFIGIPDTSRDGGEE